MREYVIFSDSTIDISQQMADELDLQVLPLCFTLGEETYRNYLDGRELEFKQFYNRLRAGEKAVTAQITFGDFLENFRPVLAEGKDILYLAFSSGLSGTFNTSNVAREQLLAEFPEAKIYCVDTLSASMGEGLLVWHAVQRKRAGGSIDEVRQWVEDNRLRLCHWFTVDDLMHLYRGGRCSGAAAFAGSLLNIKPVLHVDDLGKLVPQEKVRSSKKALAALVDKMAATAQNPEQQVIFISHSDNPAGAEHVANLVRERWPVQDVQINPIGPVIGAHTGVGTVALFFLGSPR